MIFKETIQNGTLSEVICKIFATTITYVEEKNFTYTEKLVKINT